MATELVRKSASATNGGELDSSTTQTIAGNKTFSGSVTPSGGIIGNTSSTAISSGNIGEVISTTVSSGFFQNGASGATYYDVTNHFLTLSPGKWLVMCICSVQMGFNACNVGSVYVAKPTLRQGTTVLSQGYYMLKTQASNTAYQDATAVTTFGHVNLTSSNTVKLSVRFDYGGGAADIGTKDIGIRSDVAPTTLMAIRIA